MSSSRINVTASLLIGGLTVALISLMLWSAGQAGLLSIISKTLAPMTAILVGTIGLSYFGREDFSRKDHFYFMNLFLALGLVLYSIAEISIGIIGHLQESEAFYFLISLTQFPAMLLWAFGVLGYLRASNMVLGVISDKNLVAAVVVIPVSAMFLVVSALSLLTPERNIIEVLATAPGTIGLGMIVAGLAAVIMAFREGRIRIPLGFAFISMLMIFLRQALWSVLDYSPVELGGQSLGVIAYLVLGAALASAKDMEEV